MVILCPFSLILSPLSGSSCSLLVGWLVGYIAGFEITGIISCCALPWIHWYWPSKYSHLKSHLELQSREPVRDCISIPQEFTDIWHLFSFWTGMKIQHTRTFYVTEILSVTLRIFCFYNAAALAKVTVFVFSKAKTLQYNLRWKLWNSNMFNLI